MVIRAQDGGSSQKILIGLQSNQDATVTVENDRVRMFASVAMSNAAGEAVLSTTGSNLGINQANALYTLDVGGDARITRDLTVQNKLSVLSDVTFMSNLTIHGSLNSTTINSNAYGNYINSNAAFRGEATATDVMLLYTTSNNLAFSFSNVSGKTSLYGVSNYLGVGTSAPTHTLEVNGDIGAVSSTLRKQLLVGSNIGVGTTKPTYPLDVHAHTNGISMTCSAKVVATEFSVFSDRRLKRDIAYVDNGSSLDALLGLQVCTFGYVDAKERGSALKTGLIAQDVEEVLPSCVVSASGFVPDIMEETLPVPVEGRLGVYDLKLSRELAAGTRIRCLLSCDVDVFATVLEAEADARCRVEFLDALPEPLDPIMVIGSRVSDLKMLNFEQLTTLTISALQAQEERLRAVENRLAALKGCNCWSTQPTTS